MILFHINFGTQNPYLYLHTIHILHWFVTEGFTSMLILFKVLNFCFLLVYQNFSLLDDFSVLVNFPHQFYYKLNMAFIYKLYLFSCFSQFSIVWLISSKLVWKPYFMQYPYFSFPIFCWASIRFLLYLSTVLFVSVGRSWILSMVFCEAYLIIFISRWIEASSLYFYDKYRALFNYSQWIFCFSISCCECNKDYFVSDWINISLSTTLLFFYYSILGFNYFLFLRVYCAFPDVLSLLFQYLDTSFLIFTLFLQV